MTHRLFDQNIIDLFQSMANSYLMFHIATYSKTLRYNDTDDSNFIGLNNSCKAIRNVGVGMIRHKIGNIRRILPLRNVLQLCLNSRALGPNSVQPINNLEEIYS